TYTGTVHLSSSDSQATLPSDSTLTHGLGVFTAILKQTGTQTIAATDPGDDGFFAPASGSPMAVINNGQAMAAGDFTGEGTLDLAVANNVGASVVILLGNGN